MMYILNSKYLFNPHETSSNPYQFVFVVTQTFYQLRSVGLKDQLTLNSTFTNKVRETTFRIHKIRGRNLSSHITRIEL